MSTLNNNNNNHKNDFNKLHTMLLKLTEQVSVLRHQMDWVLDHFEDDGYDDYYDEDEDEDEPVDEDEDDDYDDETDVITQCESDDDDSTILYVDNEYIDYE